MAAYYPRRVVRFQDLQKAYPGFETFDDDEEDRVEHVQISKSRGKGAPKKKRTAAGECLRKRRWERMRKRRKARLRKTNRWIVRGHGDEQEDQEEGDVSENRMLTFRDPQNQRSSARRRGNDSHQADLYIFSFSPYNHRRGGSLYKYTSHTGDGSSEKEHGITASATSRRGVLGSSMDIRHISSHRKRVGSTSSVQRNSKLYKKTSKRIYLSHSNCVCSGLQMCVENQP